LIGGTEEENFIAHISDICYNEMVALERVKNRNMKRENVLTKMSLGIVIFATISLAVYFIAVVPNPPIGLGGLLFFSPFLFGVVGLITVLLGQRKNRTILGKALVIINILLICFPSVAWFAATFLEMLS